MKLSSATVVSLLSLSLLSCAAIKESGDRDTASLGSGNGRPGGQAVETIQPSSSCGIYYPLRNRFFLGYLEDHRDQERMKFPSESPEYFALIPGPRYAEQQGAGQPLFSNETTSKNRLVDKCIPRPVASDKVLGDSPYSCQDQISLEVQPGAILQEPAEQVISCMCIFGTLVQSQVGKTKGRWIFEHIDSFGKRPLKDCTNFRNPVKLRKAWLESKQLQRAQPPGTRRPGGFSPSRRVNNR